MRNGCRWNSGFTLIELLVVIAVLAILGTIIMGGARMMMRTSRKRRFTMTKEVLQTALMRYRAEYNGWPVARDGGDAKVSFKGDNYKVFGPMRVGANSADQNPDGIRFFDETSLLTLQGDRVVPLSSMSGNSETPVVYVPVSGRGHAFYEVNIDFELDTVKVGPDDMEDGGKDDDDY